VVVQLAEDVVFAQRLLKPAKARLVRRRWASGSSRLPCSVDVIRAAKTTVTVFRTSRTTGSGMGGGVLRAAAASGAATRSTARLREAS